jgi:hypothetical protein
MLARMAFEQLKARHGEMWAEGDFAKVFGGRIALANWMPEGSIGGFFRMLGPFQPPLPDGAGNPMAWGDPAYVEALLGDAFAQPREYLLVHGVRR